jgi:hypothetical protein
MGPYYNGPDPYNTLAQGAFAGRDSLFGGTPLQARPDLNLGSLVGAGPAMSMGLNAVIQPILGQFLGPNYVPAQFNPTIGLYDQFSVKSQLQAQQQAAAAGSKFDQQMYQRIISGATQAISGQAMTPDRQAAANKAAEDMAMIAPILMPFAPDLFDQMHGRRGSGRLLGMQVGSAGRYRTDPITGAMGYSAESATAVTRGIYEELYGQNADVMAMRGFGAGQAGIMMDELTRRGAIGSTGGAANRRAAIRSIASDLGSTVEDVEASPSLGDHLQKFEGKRVASKLKDMAGAVKAVQELFGEAGRPDAPMSELISALQAMTQNNMGSMTGEQMERLVRDAGTAARNAGSDIRGVMTLSSNIAPYARSVGLSSSSAMGLAAEGFRHAAAFGQVYGDSRIPGMDKDRSALVQTTLMANARASAETTRIAALQHMAEQFEGFDTKADTDANRLLKAVAAGETEFTNVKGQKQSVALRSGTGAGSIGELMKSSGFTKEQQALYHQIVSNPLALESYREKIGDVTRQAMGRTSIQPRLQTSFGQTLAVMRDAGNLDAVLSKEIDIGKLAETALALSPEDAKALRDKGDVSPLASAIEQQLTAKGIRLTDAQKRQVKSFATMARDNAITFFGADPGTAGYASDAKDRLISSVTSNSKAMTDEAVTMRKVDAVSNRIASSLSPLGAAKPLQRLADAIASADKDTSIKKIIADTIGYIDKSDIDKVTAGPLAEIHKELQDARTTAPESVRARVKELMTSNTPESRAELKKLEQQYGMPADQIGKMSNDNMRLRRMEAARAFVEQRLPGAKAQMVDLEKKYAEQMKKSEEERKAESQPQTTRPPEETRRAAERAPITRGQAMTTTKPDQTSAATEKSDREKIHVQFPTEMRITGKLDLTSGQVVLQPDARRT